MHHPERQPQRCNRTANEKQQQRQQQQRALPSLNQPIPVGRSVFFGGVHRAREVELERSSRRLCLLACCNCTRGKNIKSSNGIDHTGDGHTRTQETPPQPPPLSCRVFWLGASPVAMATAVTRGGSTNNSNAQTSAAAFVLLILFLSLSFSLIEFQS